MAEWQENLHPREPKGSKTGGQFAPKGGTGGWGIDDDDRAEIAQYKSYTRQSATALPEIKLNGEKEEKAIRDYTDTSADINLALRQGGKIDVADLDTIFSHNELPENIVLHRFYDKTTSPIAAMVRNLDPGNIIRDKGFMSTSLLSMQEFYDLRPERISQNTIDHVKATTGELKILAPSGSHGAYLGSKAYEGWGEEEVLLARGSGLEYVGEDDDGSLVFRLRQNVTLKREPQEREEIETGLEKTQNGLETKKLLANEADAMDVTDYLSEGVLGFLTPDGRALNIELSHRRVAENSGTTMDKLYEEGTARLYASNGYLGIEIHQRPTPEQIETLCNIVNSGNYDKFTTSDSFFIFDHSPRPIAYEGRITPKVIRTELAKAFEPRDEFQYLEMEDRTMPTHEQVPIGKTFAERAANFRAGIVYHGTTRRQFDKMQAAGGIRAQSFADIIKETMNLIGQSGKYNAYQRRWIASYKREYEPKEKGALISTSTSPEISSRWAGSGGETAKMLEDLIRVDKKRLPWRSKLSPLSGEPVVLQIKLNEKGRNSEYFKRHLRQLDLVEKALAEGKPNLDEEWALGFLKDEYGDVKIEANDIESVAEVTEAFEDEGGRYSNLTEAEMVHEKALNLRKTGQPPANIDYSIDHADEAHEIIRAAGLAEVDAEDMATTFPDKLITKDIITADHLAEARGLAAGMDLVKDSVVGEIMKMKSRLALSFCSYEPDNATMATVSGPVVETLKTSTGIRPQQILVINTRFKYDFGSDPYSYSAQMGRKKYDQTGDWQAAIAETARITAAHEFTHVADNALDSILSATLFQALIQETKSEKLPRPVAIDRVIKWLKENISPYSASAPHEAVAEVASKYFNEGKLESKVLNSWAEQILRGTPEIRTKAAQVAEKRGFRKEPARVAA